MPHERILNMVWMQALWFVAVFGAAADQNWPAGLVLVFFMLWQTRPGRLVKGDLQLVLVAVVIGFLLDTLWIRLGWLAFLPESTVSVAPPWIVLLWAGLALTLNHSLAWLQTKLGWGALLSGTVSPLSYLGAEKIGAVRIATESDSWWLLIGLAWAGTIPLLLLLAIRFKSGRQR